VGLGLDLALALHQLGQGRDRVALAGEGAEGRRGSLRVLLGIALAFALGGRGLVPLFPVVFGELGGHRLALLLHLSESRLHRLLLFFVHDTPGEALAASLWGLAPWDLLRGPAHTTATGQR